MINTTRNTNAFQQLSFRPFGATMQNSPTWGFRPSFNQGTNHVRHNLARLWQAPEQRLLELLTQLLNQAGRPQPAPAPRPTTRPVQPAPPQSSGAATTRTRAAEPEATVRSSGSSWRKRTQEETFLPAGKINGVTGDSYPMNRKQLATRETAEAVAAKLSSLSGQPAQIIDQSKNWDGIFRPDTPIWEVQIGDTSYNAGLVADRYNKYPEHVADQMMRDEMSR